MSQMPIEPAALKPEPELTGDYTAADIVEALEHMKFKGDALVTLRLDREVSKSLNLLRPCVRSR
jgi:hypothetical protein